MSRTHHHKKKIYTSYNTEERKFTSKTLRVKNRELAQKIIKEDEDWEQLPYPDEYLTKQLYWDLW